MIVYDPKLKLLVIIQYAGHIRYILVRYCMIYQIKILFCNIIIISRIIIIAGKTGQDNINNSSIAI